MSTPRGIREPDGGRYYAREEEEPPIRRYEADPRPSSLSQSASNRDDRYESTPRSASSHRSSSRGTATPLTISSNRPSSSVRRESDASSRRRDSVSEYHRESDRSKPIPIARRPSSRYHDEGSYDRARETGSYRSESIGSPPSGRSYRISEGRRDSRRPDVSREPPLDSLAEGVRRMTVAEADPNQEYTVSAAAPVATSSTWGRAPISPYSISAAIPEDETPSSQWPSAIDHSRIPPERNYEDQGKQVPHGDAPQARAAKPRRFVAGTHGNSEKLDDRYQVRRNDYKKFFSTGRVFMTLWTDPHSGITNDDATFQTSVNRVSYGENVHTKIRRFVVVRHGKEDKFCLCLPVTTYNGRGHNKPGINLAEHGQIYSSKHRPREVKGIEWEPLKVNLSKGGEKLDHLSLINYTRVYTVETNVKVRDVGEIDDSSRKLLRRYWKSALTCSDDESEGPQSISQHPRRKEEDLAGVGGAVQGSQFGGYGAAPDVYGASGSQQQGAGYYDNNRRGTTTSYVPPVQAGHMTSPSYDSRATSNYPSMTAGYSQNSRSDMHRTPSSGGYQAADTRFGQNPAASTFGMQGAPSNYAQNPGSGYSMAAPSNVSYGSVVMNPYGSGSGSGSGTLPSQYAQPTYHQGQAYHSQSNMPNTAYPAPGTGAQFYSSPAPNIENRASWSSGGQGPPVEQYDPEADIDLSPTQQSRAPTATTRPRYSSNSSNTRSQASRYRERSERDRDRDY